ncbi:MAG: MucR family transcriptional regulator [Rhodospirillaceae bacterium]
MSKYNEQMVQTEGLLRLSTEIVAAYVGNNELQSNQLSDVINTVFGALKSLGDGGNAAADRTDQKPAVPIRRSITPDYLICLEDGQQLKMLKRYLRTNYNMTPEEYREKWNLPPDYPMVAPNYAKKRSEFAKSIGLGKGSGRGR